MLGASHSRILRTIPVLIVACLLAFPAQAQYSGGTGEPNDPYRIATAADLIALGETPEDYDKHFILTADIDLDPNLPGRKVFEKAVIAPLRGISSGVPLDPPFTGVFDGGGHTISNLTISRGHYLGLFGGVGSTGSVLNLGLVGATVNGTGGYIGGLVGYSFGNISNCHSAGTVSGDTYVGGLLGYCNGGSVVNCRSTATVHNNWYLGGLLGYNHNGSVANCYSAATVTGKDEAGGLVGYNGGTVTNSCSISVVRGNLRVGGLVGDSDSTIINCHSGGTVQGDQQVGGLVGSNSDVIINCYSTGPVTGTSRVGGLAGYSPGKTVISSFWDMQTSGRTASACGVGLSTAQMQDVETYLSTGWDLADESVNGTSDYWQMSPGQYPTLRYLADEGPVLLEGSGTAEDPYLIRDAWGLGMVWLEPQAYYRLEASLDLAGITWSVAVIPWFGGFFDGNGHVISHLHIQGERYLGLAGKLAPGGVISNLGVEKVDLNGSGHLVGSFAGASWGSITDCRSTGVVTGDWSTGGLVGSSSGNIANSYSTATVSGTDGIGGLAGYSTGIVTRSHSRGMTTGNKFVGGLVGRSYGGSIVDCYSTGAVAGVKYVGGLAGASSGSITGSYSTGRVSGTSNVGGMLGWNTGQVLASFWDTGRSAQTLSDGGTGKTTAEMQTAGTFLDAGWDFIDEIENGTDDIWWILEGQDYPRLWWELLGDDAVAFVVDDFEDYNDVPGHEIFSAWVDPYDVLPNGGIVGHFDPPYAEQSIVHSGLQSMPFYYTNTKGIVNSRAYRVFDSAQDWTAADPVALVLWFRGVADNGVDAFYVAVNGKTVFNPDPNAVLADTWIPWIIPLSSLAAVGANTEHVTSMQIGIGDNMRPSQNASGILYIDDIRVVKRVQ